MRHRTTLEARFAAALARAESQSLVEACALIDHVVPGTARHAVEPDHACHEVARRIVNLEIEGLDAIDCAVREALVQGRRDKRAPDQDGA